MVSPAAIVQAWQAVHRRVVPVRGNQYIQQSATISGRGGGNASYGGAALSAGFGGAVHPQRSATGLSNQGLMQQIGAVISRPRRYFSPAAVTSESYLPESREAGEVQGAKAREHWSNRPIGREGRHRATVGCAIVIVALASGSAVAFGAVVERITSPAVPTQISVGAEGEVRVSRSATQLWDQRSDRSQIPPWMSFSGTTCPRPRPGASVHTR
jgi:hypothetical protein